MIKVAVAVIIDAEQRLLITQRASHVSHPGVWEFPGGKLEQGEHAADALIREVKEEVGLDVKTYQFLTEINHTYEHRTVSLQVYLVNDFSGVANRREEQMDLRWVSFDALSAFTFPAANAAIISLLHSRLGQGLMALPRSAHFFI